MAVILINNSNITRNLADEVWLALDTATPALAIALLHRQASGAVETLAAISRIGERNHSVHLMPEMERLLRESDLRPQELSGLIAGVGPGSYTGVRMAVAAMKTMAWTLQLPLIGVSSMEALAYGAAIEDMQAAGDSGAASASGATGASGASDASGASGASDASVDRSSVAGDTGPHTIWYAPVLDARRQRVYSGLYGTMGDLGWLELGVDCIRSWADWQRELQQLAIAANVKVCIVGEATRAAEMADGSRSELESSGYFQYRDHQMSGEALGRLALEMGRGVIYSGQDIHGFSPNYTQRTEAETKRFGGEANA